MFSKSYYLDTQASIMGAQLYVCPFVCLSMIIYFEKRQSGYLLQIVCIFESMCLYTHHVDLVNYKVIN